MLRSNNPIFNGNTFNKPMTWDQFQASPAGAISAAVPRRMTIQGTITTTLILLAVTIASAVATWALLTPRPQLITLFMCGSIAIGYFSVMAVRAMPKRAMIVAPIFAVIEGIAAGSISLVYAKYFGANPGGPALIITAVLATMGVAGSMLVAYYFRVVRSSPMLVRIVGAAWLGVMFLVVAQFMLQLVLGLSIPYIWDTGIVGIGVTLVIVGLAATTLVIDFDYIERGAAESLPKEYEWVGAFGLLVTLVVLYTWILRLLAMLRSE